MSKTKVNLGITQETLLIPLWARAVELEQKNPIIKDPKSAQILQEIDYDFNKFAKAKSSQVGCCLRGLILDNLVRNYLKENPTGPIVEIGAGLNTRFERVDNGEVRWFDLDLPDSMAVRQQFFEETERRHFISGSALDTDWIERVKADAEKPLMFLAEGVLMYLSQEQVKQLFANLSNYFPGSWLAFDSVSPFIVKNQKHHDSLRHTSAKFDWGIEDIRLIKNWDSRYEVMEVYTYRDLVTQYQRRFSLFTRLISLIPVFSSMYRVALIRLG